MVIRFNDLRLARFQNSEGMVSFFNADEGKRRMSAVRDWIVGVRHPADSWGERYSDLSTRVHDLYNSRRGNILANNNMTKHNQRHKHNKKTPTTTPPILTTITTAPRATTPTTTTTTSSPHTQR